MKKNKFTIYIAVVAFLFVLSIACGSSESDQFSTSTEFDIAIDGGNLVGDVDTLRIKKNEDVILNFASDSEITVHLHGYDIEKTISAEHTSVMEFKANATGRFVVTTHEVKSDHHGDHGSHSGHGHMAADTEAHAVLFESETLSSGDTYKYEIPTDFKETIIPYHDHMSHDSIGQIEVSEHHGIAGEVFVTVKDGEHQFYPETVVVKPGAEIEWTIESEAKVRITSGLPQHMNQPSAHSDHSSHSNGESEEKTLITLEVYP